ncbi:MAG: BON domain-containing protein [Rhodospirillales bacterium]|nr:BON domain-containing protein [Rhodospirillales bacterium]
MSIPRRRSTQLLILAGLLGLSLATSGCAGMMIGAGAAAGVASAQERGLGGAARDVRIRADINDLWFKKSEDLYSRVQLQVQEGRVLLSGAVPDPETRVEAVRLAWQASGVREVINEIEIDDETTLTDRARDAWISSKLKSKLLIDKEISSINYSIEVVNQSIFLIGVAQNQAELDRVIAHARDISYVRRVVSYVRLKDRPLESS